MAALSAALACQHFALPCHGPSLLLLLHLSPASAGEEKWQPCCPSFLIFIILVPSVFASVLQLLRFAALPLCTLHLCVLSCSPLLPIPLLSSPSLLHVTRRLSLGCSLCQTESCLCVYYWQCSAGLHHGQQSSYRHAAMLERSPVLAQCWWPLQAAAMLLQCFCLLLFFSFPFMPWIMMSHCLATCAQAVAQTGVLAVW